MTKRFKHLKWAAVVPALLIMLLSVTVAYGGLRWSGIDPEVSLDDHTLNITAEWKSEDLCSIDGPVTIDIYHPAGVSANVVSESSATCENANGERVLISTVTQTHVTKSRSIKVTGTISSPTKMKARLVLELDGKQFKTCKGKTNKLIKCNKFKLR